MKQRRHRAIFAALAALSTATAHADERAGSLPQRLSETGLFAAGSTTEVAQDVAAFSPQYPLWSDGATKRRWIQLPRGSFIDASQPDAWVFPPGTRLWKEFSLGRRRVETRLIARLENGSWQYATYVWNEDQGDAVLAPAEGIASHRPDSARDERYTIPSEADCHACHEGAAVPVLGFSALQLSPDRDPLAPHADSPGSTWIDLPTLVARGWLRNLPRTLIDTPPRIAAASATQRAALGYLHGNCGHCHSAPDDSGASVPVGMVLAQSVADQMRTDEVLRALLGGSSRFRPAGARAPVPLVTPGAARASLITLRMRSRDPRVQMPPLGTAIADSAGLALIERWIDHDLQPPEELRP